MELPLVLRSPPSNEFLWNFREEATELILITPNVWDTELSGDRSPKIDGLVSEKDLLRAKGLLEKLAATLLSSSKKVTRAIYMKLWKKYNSWCSSKGLQVKNTISVLAFLHEGREKGLAASILKTQAAALSVFFGKDIIARKFAFQGLGTEKADGP